jgi:hypothetical protein
VPADEQRRQTELARRKERERKAAAWKPARSLITAGIVAYSPMADRPTLSDLRVIRRTLERIDRRLTGQ